MDSYFATAARLDDAALRAEADLVGSNPIITAILHSVSGLLAVLNDHRQILIVNDELLSALGVDSADQVFGLRLGEALDCVHSHEMPAGCGTSEVCASCGAAVAIVACLTRDMPVERECCVTTGGLKGMRDLFFRVRCVPLDYDGQRQLLLFLQDITYRQRLATLERLFFHDINGIVHGLLGLGDLLVETTAGESRDLAESVRKLSMRLASEVAVQRSLLANDLSGYLPRFRAVSIRQVFDDIKATFQHAALSENKTLILPGDAPDIVVNTEPSLLVKVLSNMVTNALEATDDGDAVIVSYESLPDALTFSVWNRRPIPADVAKRIFQRNFSTKARIGRGLGTYSMKLFGEGVLGGVVDFTSSEAEGTVFRIRLRP